MNYSCDLTVITASVESRAGKLLEAMDSVAEQTLKPKAHLVGIDITRKGAPFILNKLLNAVATEWVMVLDDDDYLLPQHVETMWNNRNKGHVIYSYCETEGRSYPFYNQPFSATNFMNRSTVSHTAMTRPITIASVNGWRDVRGWDWDLWRRIFSAGGTFHAVPEKTWVYRLNGHNESWGEVSA